MKRWLLTLALVATAGAAAAQQPADGSIRTLDRLRQERTFDGTVLRRGSGEARQLDQLQRMRQRGNERAQQFRQPDQTSRPAATPQTRRNTVVTQ